MKRTKTPSKVCELLSSGLNAAPIAPIRVELRESGKSQAMNEETRRELLAAVRGGEVVELEIKTTVFRQSKAKRPLLSSDADLANRNFTYVRKADLKKLAKSFKDRPFLKDHDRRDLMSVGGSIINSELMDDDDEFSIHQTLKLVKPWAVEAALDGTLKQFSIGFESPSAEDVRCTVCKCSLFDGKCHHFPGDLSEVAEGKEPHIVEIEYRNPIAAEVSGVSFPAVQGTSLDFIKAALSEAREPIASEIMKGEEMDENTKIALGLTAEASTKDVEDAIAQLKAKAAANAELEKQSKTAAESLAEAQGVIKEVQGQLAEERKAAKGKRTAELSEKALKNGLWAKGSKQESYFAKLAETSIEAAEEYFETLEPIIPVGGELQSGKGAEVSGDPATVAGYLSAQGVSDTQAALAEETFKKYGITADKLANSGPNGIRG